MAQLAPIQLEDGTTIYIEASEDFIRQDEPLGESPEAIAPERSRGNQGGAIKGWTSSHQILPRLAQTQRMDAMETTIRAYTQQTLKAFKQLAHADIDRVTLEFGVKLSGEAGIPYITKGSAASNLRITVECSFPAS